MDHQRFQYEKALFERYFPRKHQFVDIEDPSAACVEVAHTTHAGRSFLLRISIPADYPNSVPKAYVLHPKPDDFTDHSGRPLYSLGPSHTMHLLTPQGKFVQLCHFKPQDWHANCSLYLVAHKCACWLEVYEDHLRTGSPIDSYVKS